MDGEYRARVPKCRVFGVLRSEQHRDQRRLPIVAVKDVGHAENFRALEDGAAKQSKALGVVRKIAGGGAVQSLTIKEGRVIDKKETNPRIPSPGQNGREAIAVIEGHSNAL